MNDNNILKNYQEINILLKECRINEAIRRLREILQIVNLPDIFRQLQTTEETYKYMIHYLFEGMQDKNRGEVLADIKESLLGINDQIMRNLQSKANESYYYEKLRLNNYRSENISELLSQYGSIVSELSLAEAVGNEANDIHKKRELILEQIFNNIFTSLGAVNDYTQLKDYLLSGYSDKYILAQTLSAITLSLLKFYDRAKLIFLIDIYEKSNDASAQARALAGIVFSLMLHKDRIINDSKITSRLYLWNDSIDTYRHLRETIRVIVGTRDTQRVANKMRDEVIPELLKLRPEILKSLREGNMESNSAFLENNPEWEEMLEKSGLNDKMRELSEMQSDGADIMMVTFSNLKQFPFFNAANNWFLPFDMNHSSLELDEELKKFISLLATSKANICDSDLYSLAFASVMMPDSQKQMISNQITAQFEQMNEELNSKVADSSFPEFDSEILKNVREYYRFFKLFKKKTELSNPFDKTVNFIEMPIIGEILENDEIFRILGEFYFKRNYYREAIPLFTSLSESYPDDSILFEKLGYCHQSIGNYKEALEAYDKASFLKPAGLWLTKKLAIVNRRLGYFDKAISHYEKALDMDPENISLIMSLGNVMLETENLPAAIQQFYHANYLSPDNPKILRAIAWVELLNGNFTKSSDYYARIISRDAKKSDYLNAGHAQLLQNNYKESLNFYRLSAQDNKNEFEKAFLSDLEILVKLGANKTTALLIYDNV